MSMYVIALGANLDLQGLSPRDSLVRAVGAMVCDGLAVDRVSRIYRTPCFPAGAGPDYANAVLTLRSDLDPQALLRRLNAIEDEFGRERQQRWGARTLDLDIVACGDRVLPDRATWQAWRDLTPEDQLTRTPEHLILPHPRMQDRAFVLVPMMDVAPDWVHPLTGLTTRQMHDALPKNLRAEVVSL